MTLTPSTHSAASGVKTALSTFQSAVRDVDAYPVFLSDQGFDPNTVRTAEDFARIPPMTKANYIAAYNLSQLMVGSSATAACIWSSSSGSSGSSSYWPRAELSVEQSVLLHDRILRQLGADSTKTLVVVCFAMGNWIGGTYTLRAIELLRDKGFPVSAVAPGVHVDAVRESISKLGALYEQVIVAGYPPFVRDVLDGAGPAVLSLDLKFLLAGESIAEEWRDGILSLVGKCQRPEDICLVYGTADAGMMGHETPTTIAVRRLALADSRLDHALFGGAAASSTLVEYDSSMRYVETDEDGFLLFTVDNTIPLVRYRINDIGRVLTASEIESELDGLGIDLEITTTTAASGFIVLERRADVATSFYAVNIYPEPVRTALADRAFADITTGKFFFTEHLGDDLRACLSLHVELRAGIESAMRADAACADSIRRRVVEALRSASTEFCELHTMLGRSAEPFIEFHPFGSAGFEVAIKLRHNKKASEL